MANDFVLRTQNGRFLVRASNLWVRDFGPPSGMLDPIPPQGPVADAIRTAGLELADALYYRETVIFEGDAITASGVLTEEQAPAELVRGSYRAGGSIHTLSGGDGALVLEPRYPSAMGMFAGSLLARRKKK